MISFKVVKSEEHLKPTLLTKDCRACGQAYRLIAFDDEPVHLCPRRQNAPTMGVPASEYSDELLIKATLGERYFIEEILDKGGMGVVYKARHAVLSNSVAIKVLHQRKQASSLKRFFREARLASKIKHPNIVYIQDFGMLPNGLPYLVMEYVTGATLAVKLSRGPLDPLQACQIAVQIARGIEAVHDAGIVHRDLKPENIILTHQGAVQDQVKIIDFGIAKEVRTTTPVPGEDAEPGLSGLHRLTPLNQTAGDTKAASAIEGSPSLTRAGAFIGSPRYMSPEQIQGEELDARSDQYAFGCILYQMLTGSPPFSHASSVDLMEMHLTAPVTPPRVLCPNLTISDSLERLVMQTLSKKPAERFATMKELAQAIGREAELLMIERGLSVNVPVETAAWISSARGPAFVPARALRKYLIPAVLAVGVAVAALAWLGYRTMGGRSRMTTEQLMHARSLALSTLTELVRGSDVSLRAAALRALGLSHESSVRSTLEQALTDADPAIKTSASEALGLLGERAAVPALLAVLEKSTEAGVKISAARALDNIDERLGLAYLERCLHSSDAGTQSAAALALCARGGRAANAALTSLLGSRGLSNAAELTILDCLTRASDPEALSQLRTRITSGSGSSFESQMNAAGKLAQLGDDSGREFLRGLVARRDEHQLVAARLLASSADPSTVGIFRQILADSRATAAAQQLAAEGIGLSGEVADLALLVPYMSAGSAPTLRVAAARSTLQLSARDPAFLSQNTLAWVQVAVGDPSEIVRQTAVDTLAENVTHDIIPVLLGLLRDRHSAVRQRVVRALGQRASAAVISALRRGLSDPDQEVRMETIRALRRAILASAPSRAAALSNLKDALLPVLKDGTRAEQLIARSQLHQLGDTEQLRVLLASQRSTVPAERLAVVNENPHTPQLLREFLQDSDWSIRWSAARSLAELGDQAAVPVHKEALTRGGPESYAAAYWLGRLSNTAVKLPEIEQLFSNQDTTARLRLLETLAGLPAEVTAPLLQRASRDGEPLVRLLVVALLSERMTTGGPAPFLRALLGLVRDENLAVRMRASALLGRVEPVMQPNRPSGAALPSLDWSYLEPRASYDIAATADELAASNANKAAAEESVTLSVRAPTAVWFRIDSRSWQAAAHANVALPRGVHTVTTLDGPQSVELKTSQQLSLKESALEQLVSSGLHAIRKNNLREGQRALERALLVCSRNRKIEQPCNSLSYDLSFRLAAVYEEQGLLVEAMKELQRLDALTQARSERPEQRAAVAEGIRRLSSRLGQVIISSKGKRGCTQKTMWLPPGRHSVKQGSEAHIVEVRARQVLEVGSCK